MKVTLLGFDPSLTKATTNEADSNIKHANSKNDANPKNQNIALKKTLNIYSLNINGLLSDIDELRVLLMTTGWILFVSVKQRLMTKYMILILRLIIICS